MPVFETFSGVVFQESDLSILMRKAQNEAQHKYLSFSSNKVPVRFLAGLHDPSRFNVEATNGMFRKKSSNDDVRQKMEDKYQGF